MAMGGMDKSIVKDIIKDIPITIQFIWDNQLETNIEGLLQLKVSKVIFLVLFLCLFHFQSLLIPKSSILLYKFSLNKNCFEIFLWKNWQFFIIKLEFFVFSSYNKLYMDCLSLSYLLTNVSMVYLITSIYTVFLQTKIHEKAVTPRLRLGYWFDSVTYGRKYVPLLGYLCIILGFAAFTRQQGNYYYLAGSLAFLFTPLFVGLVGKLPIAVKKMTRVHQRYEANQNMTQNEAKGVELLMNRWIFFHKIRCVIALAAHACFVVGMHVASSTFQHVENVKTA